MPSNELTWKDFETNEHLKRTIMRAWVSALKTNAFVQGQEYLCHSDIGLCRYCCLGVLCEIVHIIAPHLLGKKFNAGSGVYDYVVHQSDTDFRYLYERIKLPLPVAAIIPNGMISSLGSATSPVVETLSLGKRTLMELNDNSKKDFRFIANSIERNAFV